MIKIGLTGSIGMGKSTTAGLFSEAGVPVWDADAAVSRLYQLNAQGTEAIASLAPEAVDENGVNKDTLKALIHRDPSFLPKLEAVIHPLVADDRKRFLQENTDVDVVLLDIPLLFENQSENQVDVIVVVTAEASVQKQRVMSRGTMGEDMFNLILSKQLPDAEKRKRADFVIETTSIEHVREQVKNILAKIRRD